MIISKIKVLYNLDLPFIESKRFCGAAFKLLFDDEPFVLVDVTFCVGNDDS